MSARPLPPACLALAGGAPAWLLLAWLLWPQPWLIYPKILLLALSGAVWLGTAWALHVRTEHQRQTLGNLLEGIAAGDYSQRLRPSSTSDLLGAQVNRLVDSLHRQRQQTDAAMRLVESVVEGLDVAVFAFDAQALLRLANPSALALLGRRSEQALGQSAATLGLAGLLEADTGELREHVFDGAAGLWRLRRQHYEVDGRPHCLLFVTDLKQVLRSEELQAWHRLLRVLSHEVHNSLTPIASLGASLRQQLQRADGAADLRADLDEGLAIMQERALHLSEFVRRYAQLARLPEPHKTLFDLGALLRRLPAMLPEAGLSLAFEGVDGGGEGQVLPFFGDAAQIEQLLINLLKNGVEAGGAPMLLRCQAQPLQLELLDRGHGIANPANLFVPFYTTKPEGSGIGLVLARQIAEAHQGSLSLAAREDGPGCVASLRFASQRPGQAL